MSLKADFGGALRKQQTQTAIKNALYAQRQDMVQYIKQQMFKKPKI